MEFDSEKIFSEKKKTDSEKKKRKCKFFFIPLHLEDVSSGAIRKSHKRVGMN